MEDKNRCGSLEDHTGADSGRLSSYPGPVIPRVGGQMPEQRPGWFRVPAPGGKYTKVRCVGVAVNLQ